MVRGIDGAKPKKNPWKSRMERDIIILHRDIVEAYTQGGKAIGEVMRKQIIKNKKKKITK